MHLGRSGTMSDYSKKIGNHEFWLDRPVFITGGTGLVGSSLVATLRALGADLVILVRDWVPESELLKSGIVGDVKIVRGDICDKDLLQRILADYEIDTVFHLAAQTIVTVANRNPVDTLKINIEGTWNLLEACRNNPTVKNIVIASSDKAYGEKEKLPYDEEMSLEGKHPYDASKSCADIVAQMYAHTYESPVVITRCGNFYGPGDLNWNRIVPGTIRSIIRNKQPIIRSDGTFIRDYIYVGDAVGAYIILAEKNAVMPELRGQAFNFSNENQVDVKGMVELIIKLMGSSLSTIIKNEVKAEIKNQYLSATKAKGLLGWAPFYTLEEGLTETVEWYEKNIKKVLE